MATEYDLAVKDLQPFPLKKLKEFMKECNAHHPVKGYSKMKKKDIIHFIATLHDNVLSGKGILSFGLNVLKKVGQHALKDAKKGIIKGVKDLASTTGNLLLKNIDEHASRPLDEQQQQQHLQDVERDKEYQKYEKIRNEIKWGR